MPITNVHERELPASTVQIGALLDRLFGPEDCLWPAVQWPMSRSGELRIGAACHHDHIRYTVTEYQPGQRVWFAFTEIDLHGGHGLEVLKEEGATRLRHTLRARPRRSMRILWPLIVRPVHDAILEDLLDNAEREVTGTVASPHRYSRWIRVLRAINSRPERRAPAPAPALAVGDPSGGGGSAGRTITVRTRTGGAATALALAGLAGLHAYWARGGLWPGNDPASLGKTVVGPGAELPPSPAVWAVAGLLGASAAAVATATALREPPSLARTMTRVTGRVLLARGVGGIPLSLIHGLDTRFGRLNAVLYSPLCVALSRGTLLAG